MATVVVGSRSLSTVSGAIEVPSARTRAGAGIATVGRPRRLVTTVPSALKSVISRNSGKVRT